MTFKAHSTVVQDDSQVILVLGKRETSNVCRFVTVINVNGQT